MQKEKSEVAVSVLLWQKILIGYLIVINVVTFIVYAADKVKAVRGSFRIREAVLLLLAFLGGSVGAILAMLICRHKIRKWYFAAGVPCLIMVQFVIFIVVYLNYFR